MGVNTWAIMITLAMLIVSGEVWTTFDFLTRHPEAVYDNLAIATTSATGQLFIFYTIKKFGPIIFTIVMTTRQVFSMVLSTFMFGHTLGPPSLLGTVVVF